MYELVEQNQLGKVDQAEVEALYHRYKNKSGELRTLVQNRFKELKASLKIQEQQIESILNRNLKYLEQQFQGLRDQPTRLIDDAERWLKTAKVKLDNFTKNSENPSFIAFDMLEKKSKGGSEDFMETGENILSQLAEHKDISVTKVETTIQQLDVKFDQNAVKSINEICKCNLIEGAENSIDEAKPDDPSSNKF